MRKKELEIPSIKTMSLFRHSIIHWFDINGRNYEWRRTKDPFRVLIAEIMLRRTKADQVREVYKNLFEKYPHACDLARANDDELQQIIYPLGLHWRNPVFKDIARIISDNYKGRVPSTRGELTALPGVGDYVAGAVLSIAFMQKEWVADINIVRVFKRYFGVNTIKEGRRDRHIIAMAKIYGSARNPKKANLAILDFAALVCTARNPRHDQCPLVLKCFYIRNSYQ